MSGKKRMIKSVVTGLLCGMLVSVVLMCLAALAMTKTGLLPVWIVEYLTAGCLAAGAFAGGFIAAKLNRGAALTIGAITGAAMIAALLLTAAL
ncbi:MAG: TIGR04086 family membrane protein, partial [Ruminococcus sp.]|nr:TIGR04086 family membrane protein [Ruminococcus sp.]